MDGLKQNTFILLVISIIANVLSYPMIVYENQENQNYKQYEVPTSKLVKNSENPMIIYENQEDGNNISHEVPTNKVVKRSARFPNSFEEVPEYQENQV